MATLNVVVTGHVQGVGFRDFVRRTAQIFGVRGEVWNRADGAVEMIVEHEDAPHLDAFVKMMPQGPGLVQTVDAEPAAEGRFEGFRVGVTRP